MVTGGPRDDNTTVVGGRVSDIASPVPGAWTVPCDDCGELTWISSTWKDKKIDRVICKQCYLAKYKDKNYDAFVTEETVQLALKTLHDRGIDITREKLLNDLETFAGRPLKIKSVEMRSADELITLDEIELLKTNPRQLSWKDMDAVKGLVVPMVPLKLKSGYLVSYTIDSIFSEQDIKLEHITVGAELFEPDPAEMDNIARSILGDCFRPPEDWGTGSGKVHYLRITGIDDTELKEFHDAGIEMGVAVIPAKR